MRLYRLGILLSALVLIAGACSNDTAAREQLSALQTQVAMPTATSTATAQPTVTPTPPPTPQICDLIVGGTMVNSNSKIGTKTPLKLQIRSARSDTIYEVTTQSVCTVANEGCVPDSGYDIGDNWPPACGSGR